MYSGLGVLGLIISALIVTWFLYFRAIDRMEPPEKKWPHITMAQEVVESSPETAVGDDWLETDEPLFSASEDAESLPPAKASQQPHRTFPSQRQGPSKPGLGSTKKPSQGARDEIEVGNDYYDAGQFDQAAIAFKEAYLNKPTHRAEAGIKLALSLAKLGRYEDAVNVLSQMIVNNDLNDKGAEYAQGLMNQFTQVVAQGQATSKARISGTVQPRKK
jgi:tetratricopeptide (TPR) repeat protein